MELGHAIRSRAEPSLRKVRYAAAEKVDAGTEQSPDHSQTMRKQCRPFRRENHLRLERSRRSMVPGLSNMSFLNWNAGNWESLDNADRDQYLLQSEHDSRNEAK
jgi:hypothetical protein